MLWGQSSCFYRETCSTPAKGLWQGNSCLFIVTQLSDFHSYGLSSWRFRLSCQVCTPGPVLSFFISPLKGTMYGCRATALFCVLSKQYAAYIFCLDLSPLVCAHAFSINKLCACLQCGGLINGIPAMVPYASEAQVASTVDGCEVTPWNMAAPPVACPDMAAAKIPLRCASSACM